VSRFVLVTPEKRVKNSAFSIELYSSLQDDRTVILGLNLDVNLINKQGNTCARAHIHTHTHTHTHTQRNAVTDSAMIKSNSFEQEMTNLKN
jgi:hypothetical protein